MVTEAECDRAIIIAETYPEGTPEYTRAWGILADYVYQSNIELNEVMYGNLKHPDDNDYQAQEFNRYIKYGAMQ